MPSPADFPAQLGRYVIERILGRGAMGVVYLAFDPHIERQVALKTIRRELAPGETPDESAHDLTARFLNEARAAGRLVHPNIVAVYDYGEAGDTAFITMEYVRGESLAAHLTEHVRAGSRMGAPRALRWFVQLLDALDYAHGAGIVHRDIKPANLLIAQRGECKIADFGIAHLDSSYLTQFGTMLGTPSYMSPEQFTGDPVDARADLFSAAVVLYEMLTCVCPFTGTPSVVMQKVLNDTPPAPSTIAPDLPGYIDAMLMKALSKRPQDRFASAREWRDTLLAELAADNEDAERTVLAYASPAATLDVAPASGKSTVSGASRTWPPEWIAQLEARLASHVGPVATLLLRRASASAADVNALRERLATYLPDEAARREFDSLLSQLDAGSSRARPAQKISVDEVSDATRQLTTYLGPIARVIARRAAASAPDLQTFHARLLDTVPQQKDRDALRRAWKKNTTINHD
ncbi:serine/threonine-protein kinase [Paraburkholderia sp. BL23I1N1]|uniref:serine/threonine-protein kinase n=1 Tax=Paraburkholderia sp. BL23I1N1 TaxID=1938802 RepID=UPI000E75136D|nr:serine/threonine-protein kinase [Paraburkholderia sp. BL23I1N1]RKE36302.1 serine/threonine-protein kinase [Paraburkholderia sp. BL23I1N1]